MPSTSECSVNDPYSYDNELPARVADVCLLTARADLIIVRHVDIKHQLLTLGTEVGLLHSVLHTGLQEMDSCMTSHTHHNKLLYAASACMCMCAYVHV